MSDALRTLVKITRMGSWWPYKIEGDVPPVIVNEFRRLCRLHGVKGWRVVSISRTEFDWLAVGVCNQREKHIALCHWMWDYNSDNHPDIIDVLRHEFAHILAGRRSNDPHDEVWEAKARLVGCTHVPNERFSAYATLRIPDHIKQTYGM